MSSTSQRTAVPVWFPDGARELRCSAGGSAPAGFGKRRLPAGPAAANSVTPPHPAHQVSTFPYQHAFKIMSADFFCDAIDQGPAGRQSAEASAENGQTRGGRKCSCHRDLVCGLRRRASRDTRRITRASRWQPWTGVQTPYHRAQIASQAKNAQAIPASSGMNWKCAWPALRRAILFIDRGTPSRNETDVSIWGQRRLPKTSDTAARNFCYNWARRPRTHSSRFARHGLSISGNARRITYR